MSSKIVNILKKGAGLLALASGQPTVGMALLRDAPKDPGGTPPEPMGAAAPQPEPARILEQEEFKRQAGVF